MQKGILNNQLSCERVNKPRGEIMRKFKHKIISLTIIAFNLAIMSTSALSANVPCNVQLEFDSNSTGSVAN